MRQRWFSVGAEASARRRWLHWRRPGARFSIPPGSRWNHPPSENLEIGEVSLPELVGPRGLFPELIGRLHHDMRRCRDQILCLQNPVNVRFRYKILPLVGVFHGRLAGRQILMLERKLDDVRPRLVREAIPHGPGVRRCVLKSIKPPVRPPIIPAAIGRAGDAQHGQRLASRQMRGFHGADDLQLFRCGIPHASHSPSPIMLFLSRRFPKVRSATTSFSAADSVRSSLTSGDVA